MDLRFSVDLLDSKAVCALVCALVLTACMSPIRTEHDSDPAADFAKYRSFAWISEDPVMGPRPGVAGGEYISPIDEQRIRSAVDATLLAKGYRRAESLGTADLVVSFTIGSQQKVRAASTPGSARFNAASAAFSRASAAASSFFLDFQVLPAAWPGADPR